MNPKATIVILTYNQEAYVQDAIEAALGQSAQSLEIVISDDRSSDKTYQVIEKTLQNNKKDGYNIRLNRNAENLGLIEHINFVIRNLVSSDIIIFASGDDVSERERAQAVLDAFEDHKVMAVFSNASVITNDHLEANLSYFMADAIPDKHTFFSLVNNRFGILGATGAYRKRVFTEFDPLNAKTRNEDTLLPVRAALLGTIKILNKCLVRYRIHDQNLSLTFSSHEDQDLDFSRKDLLTSLKAVQTNWELVLKECDGLNEEQKLLVERKLKRIKLRMDLITNPNMIKRLSSVAHYQGAGFQERIWLIVAALHPNIAVLRHRHEKARKRRNWGLAS